MMRRVTMAVLAVAMMAGTAFAQSTTSMMQPDRRPATTTVDGDTGLWFVPTAEVLGPRKWSFSAYRKNFDFEQGFTDVTTVPVTFAFGLGERVEFFTAIEAVRRIDRDSRPIFFDNGRDEGGGLTNNFPFVREAWSGNDFGDIWVGAKFNFMSQYEQDPVSFGLRGRVKIPTADEDEGAGTGKMDFGVDAILSGEANERVEWAGTVGYLHRGDPDTIDISNSFKWGFGLGFPSRQGLRLTTELHGEFYMNDDVTTTTRLVGQDGSRSPLVSGQDSPINATVGLTWQHRNGFFAGAGVNWAIKLDGRSEAGNFEDEGGDSLGLQLRLGYHPGVRVYTPPPPPPPPPPPAAMENRGPSVTVRCEPGTVFPGRTATVIATAQDPDGDALTYRWTAANGTLATAMDRQSVWTAPMAIGSYPVVVTVTDARGATASDTATCQVVAEPMKEIVFEDVYFDFDRYSLRQDALRVLDEAVKAMQDNASLRLEIEGHTCNIGTAEYNLALGERRAMSVRDYLVSRGISTDRLRTVSYGEERPKHDNAREETRRLNRRAALVVRLTVE
ncbi:MAG: OmpA family protein [Acidobacteriota bacterium]|nr:OmpA family protein [Acidobacteriota bacterium]